MCVSDALAVSLVQVATSLPMLLFALPGLHPEIHKSALGGVSGFDLPILAAELLENRHDLRRCCLFEVESKCGILAHAQPLHLRSVDAQKRAQSRALVGGAAEGLHQVGREVADLHVADELAHLRLIEHRLLHLDQQSRELDAGARQVLGAQRVAPVGGGLEIDARVVSEVAEDRGQHRDGGGDDHQGDALLPRDRLHELLAPAAHCGRPRPPSGLANGLVARPGLPPVVPPVPPVVPPGVVASGGEPGIC